MSRLKSRFDELRRRQRVALVPFVTAGDPEPGVTVPLLHALVAAGADVLELGVPFSDPMADGPVIQQASERALKHHMTLSRVLEMVREFRRQDPDTPVVLMGYLNPVEAMGYDRFAADAAAAGVDGALTVDLPPEEGEELGAALARHGLDPVYLLAPTSGPERMQRIAAAARGFLYYVSLRGVTGAAHLDVGEVRRRIAEIRTHTALPLGVGFGINSPEAAAEVAGFADAVVVGSALVKRLAALTGQPDRIPAELGAFLATLRAAMDRAAPRATGVSA